MANEELRSFFESLVTEGDLHKLKEEKTKEGLYLEFKTKADSRNPELDADDKKNFSRALSGFANSDGGILIWGIATDRNEQAKALKPIADIHAFQAALKKSLINATQPIVDGILIEIISKVDTSSDGYIKCLVPTSDKAPHRAMLSNREYYKRSTEGFYRLEHFDLEDMFGRRPHPSLSVIVELRPRPGDDPHEEVYFSFRNDGRGIAKHAGFLCIFEAGVQIATARGSIQNATNLNHGTATISYQDNTGVIHPNSVNYSLGHVVIKRQGKGLNLQITLKWYCENMLPRSVSAAVPPEP
jgi:Putative DNA-binding domain